MFHNMLPVALAGGASALKTGILDLFFPNQCNSCRDMTADPGLCSECRSEIIYIYKDRCFKCGKPLGKHAGERKRCLECKKTHYYFRKTLALCRYGGPVRDLIHSFKYGKDFSSYHELKRIIKNGIALHKVETVYDHIVPVPLYVIDEIKRGFNQSSMIAHYAANVLGYRFSPVLRKKKRTQKQVSLSKNDRKKNLEGAFSCSKGSVAGMNILLVDDIFTTGSTLSVCAQVLKKRGGARSVDILVIGR